MNSSISLCAFSLLLLASLVPQKECYSFDNHELNEHLRQNLEEYMHLADEEPRAKRDAKDEGNGSDDKFVCKHRHFRSCCGDDNLMKKFIEKDKSIGKSCYRNVSAKMDELKTNQQMGDPMDFFSCEGLKNMKKKIYCVNECIGKKQELLNEDGSLNQEKIQAYVTAENFKEDWQKDLVTAGLNECLKKDFYKTSFPKEESTDGAGLNCNPTYLQFLSCLYKEVEIGCPDQYQKNNKKCKAMRENFANNKKRMLDLLKN
ncbi:hypothetical protein M8J77_014618 [Diaphorina citri]|nr:hypothetical protein M8J77_014618 [Diaphorina citri]